MSQGPLFVRPEVFAEMVGRVSTLKGTQYKDVTTIYGDMSRLVVAWLATTPPEELRALYNQLEWEGAANIPAIQKAAQEWLLNYHPDRASRLGITARAERGNRAAYEAILAKVPDAEPDERDRL
jgi:hypothetical protein